MLVCIVQKCVCECRLPCRLKEWIPGARIIGGCELPVWMLGTELRASARLV